MLVPNNNPNLTLLPYKSRDVIGHMTVGVYRSISFLTDDPLKPFLYLAWLLICVKHLAKHIPIENA